MVSLAVTFPNAIFSNCNDPRPFRWKRHAPFNQAVDAFANRLIDYGTTEEDSNHFDAIRCIAPKGQHAQLSIVGHGCPTRAVAGPALEPFPTFSVTGAAVQVR